MEITSLQNAKIKQWMKYHQKKHRDQDHLFFVEGEHLIEEAYQAKQIATLLIRSGYENVFGFDGEVFELSDSVMDKLSKNISDVNYMAICRQTVRTIGGLKRIILLDDVQDPGNLGTIIRSAYSFGFDVVYLSEHCVDVYNEKVIRSTQGALFHIPIVRGNLREIVLQLQSEGVPVLATSLRDARTLDDVVACERMAFIFGNEGSGVSDALISLSDQTLKIEMYAFESLNVGVAASICMYTFRRR